MPPKGDWGRDPRNYRPPSAAQRWLPPTGEDSSRTGSVKLLTTSGAPSDQAALSPQVLCQATFDKPEPCTVHIGVALATQYSGRASWDFTAKGGNAEAILIFVYGAGQALRTVKCDLRPGSYQLPPCNQVTVSVQVADATPL